MVVPTRALQGARSAATPPPSGFSPAGTSTGLPTVATASAGAGWIGDGCVSLGWLCR